MEEAKEVLCWICGSPATSREHRIKRSDLLRAFGRAPYKGSDSLVHVRDGVLTPIQGPNADRLKYAPSICQQCNSAGTQPYDLAYERFMSWVFDNEKEVLRRRMIDFQDVFGGTFEAGQRNLYKYFVKSAGCRLVDAKAPVPIDLVELLPKDRFRTRLRISLSVNEDVLTFHQHGGPSWPGKGELRWWQSQDDPGSLEGFTWNEYVNWLTVCYWYNQPVEGPMGATWVADSQYIYLGSFAPLSPEMRSDARSRNG